MKIWEPTRRLKDKYKLHVAVKEALDTLPAAVCYFTPTGTVKLCNRTMYALFRRITQSDLQSFYELKEALDGCDKSTGIIRDGNVFLFPDGRAWQYSAEEVETADGKVYTEAVFSDVTELYEKRQELKRQSRELKKMYQELKILSENVLEAAREQEALNMKSRLHDQMNMGVAAIRQMLRQDTTSEENAAAVMQFRRAIQILQEENAYPQDDVAEFIRDAAAAGIQVKITGELPKTKEAIHLLLPVMREACVNAARHADAAMLYVMVEQSGSAVTLHMSNDGKQPKEGIVPRGGLADLGKMIAEAGGRMEIQSQPVFVLTGLMMLTACGSNGRQKEPITLTVWHVYGGQTDSPLNDLIDEFNETVGAEEGIKLQVTVVSNTNNIHDAVLRAANDEPGTSGLPDMFISYPKTVLAMPDPEILVDYRDYFSDGELSAYMPAFLEEGEIDGRLVVFPVAKSTEIMFIDKTLFDRFAADTGAALEQLDTWEGLYALSKEYYRWTDAQTPESPETGKHFLSMTIILIISR